MQPNNRSVLLVEDDQNIRELYAMALIKAGIEILMAENGEQAVRIALAKHPALILLDIDMPLMNGYEAAREIRADRWGATVPIIFLTNRNDPADEAHAAPQRPEQYIVKANLSVKEVMAIIETALPKKKPALRL